MERIKDLIARVTVDLDAACLRVHLNECETDVEMKKYFYTVCVHQLLLRATKEFTVDKNSDTRDRLSGVCRLLVAHCPPEVILPSLCNCLKTSSGRLSLNLITSLLVQFVSGDQISTLIFKVSKTTSSIDGIRLLLNIPTFAANRLGKEVPGILATDQFYQYVIVKFLNSLIQNKVYFVADGLCPVFIGLLCFLGHGTAFWKEFFVYKNRRTSVCLDRWCAVLSAVNALHTEATLTPLFVNCVSYALLENVLGNLVNISASTESLLSKKLLFIRYFADLLPVKNLLRYLFRNSYNKFCSALVTISKLWSEPGVVQRSNIEQHRYLTWLLVFGVRLLAQRKSSTTCSSYSDITAVILAGISVHFQSNVDEFRLLGMVAGETITDLLQLATSEETRLKFEYKDCLDVQLIKELAYKDFDAELDEHCSSLNFSLTQQCSLLPSEQTSSHTETFTDEINDNETPLDSDDDLEPVVPLSTETPRKRLKKPVYLRDCLDGLLCSKPEEFDKLEASINAVEGLIKAHLTSVKDLSIELATVLLHLDTSVELIDNFPLKRINALIALVLADTDVVVPFLTKQIFLSEYSISQRLDILEVLQSSALQLSSHSPDVSRVPASHSETSSTCKSPTSSLVRLEAKTRRWGIAKNAIKPAKPNHFHSFCGLFFYDILKSYDMREKFLDLAGQDHLVLGRLFYTVGVVYFCSENAGAQRKMLSTLLNLLPHVCSHPEAAVRRGILFCYTVIGLATPTNLLTDFAFDLDNLKSGLQNAACEDPDIECRQLALHSLSIFSSKFCKLLANS